LYTEEQYFKSPEEMVELFADLPEALENSVEIAKRCNLQITLGKSYLPDFPTPDGHDARRFPAPGGRRRVSKSACSSSFPTRSSALRSARPTTLACSSRPTPSSRWDSPATS
jgi:DNA polymerase-3 subunit alpha